MFNKKPFNRKDGEDRVCTTCGVTFHTMRPRNVCPPCVNQIAREKNRANGNKERHGRPSDLEGIGYEQRKVQWTKKARWIEKNLNERSEWQEYFRQELQRISEDEKLWASLTRETLGMTPKRGEENEDVKIGRPSNNDKQWMTWEEYEANGWGLPEDD
jgi:hypothetical protein